MTLQDSKTEQRRLSHYTKSLRCAIDEIHQHNSYGYRTARHITRIITGQSPSALNRKAKKQASRQRYKKKINTKRYAFGDHAISVMQLLYCKRTLKHRIASFHRINVSVNIRNMIMSFNSSDVSDYIRNMILKIKLFNSKKGKHYGARH